MPLPALLSLLLLPGRGVCGDLYVQAVEAVEQFKAETVFWEQLEIGRKIVLTKETRVLSELEPWLTHPDRHIRGNTAFVFGGLGDPRGFEVIAAILRDRSDRPEGQGGACVIRGGGSSCWSLPLQIASDRYYAVHLLGELKDPKAVPILVSFLDDPDVNYKIPWALRSIGGKSAIQGLMSALGSPSPEARVFAIEDLEDLQVVEAIPALSPLLSDQAVSAYDRRGYVKDGITVREAARTAIATLQHVSSEAR